jgi:type II secretory pathway component GspD/PulD (secretin)
METTPGLRIGLALVLSLGSLLVAPLAAAQGQPRPRDRREINLSPGEQRILPGAGVDSISTGSPGIIQVRVTDDQKQVVVVGMAPGTTTLLMIMTSGERLEYVVTVSNLQPRRNVRLDIYFVQLQRRRGLQLGVGWPGNIAATLVGQALADHTGAYTAQVTGTSQILPQLDFLRTRGWAKVLDHARIVVANGDEGTYSSTGELNARISNNLTTGLQKLVFGSSVTVRLNYDDTTGRLEGRVQAEVSKLAGASLDDIPQRNVVQIDTTVNLEVGQSLALGGLFSDEEVADSRGLPIFSEIPILGIFFGTHGRREERNENVVFIVPSLVGAVAIEQRDRVSEALRLLEDYEGDRDERGTMRKLSDDRALPALPPKTVPIVPGPSRQRPEPPEGR